MTPERRDRLLGLLFDVAAVVALSALAASVWGACAVQSDVAGDAFVALECGRRWNEFGFSQPSQPIFGYGLCASYAPLFWGAESLWEVVWRRSLVAAAIVPATYVLVRVAVPAIVRLSPIALRFGAVAAALAIHQNEALGRITSTGSHGYFSYSWTLVAFVGWAIAIRVHDADAGPESRISRATRALGAALGMVAAPMAMMNHPYAGWTALTAIALLPLLVRRAGIAATIGSVALGLAVAWPRMTELARQTTGGEVALGEIAHQPGDWSLGEGELWGWFLDARYMPPLVGIAILVILGALAASDRERRWTVASWTAGGVGAVLGLTFLGRSVGYLQHYHVLLVFPFAAIGLGLGCAWLPEVVARRLGRMAGVAIAAVLLVVILVTTSTADDGDNPITDPWCTTAPPNGSTGLGSRALEQAIAGDVAAHSPSARPVLITNLNLADGRLDSAVPVSMGLVLAGFPKERLLCCGPDSEAPIWYFIIDVGNPDLDYRGWARLPGVDILLDRPEVNELLVVVRTQEALDAIGVELCAAIPADRTVAVHYYQEVINRLTDGRVERLAPPPSPVPSCLSRMQ